MKEQYQKLKEKQERDLDDIIEHRDIKEDLDNFENEISIVIIEEKKLDKFIDQVRQETIEYERERIKDWATKYILRDMKIYGTDKHGIALEDLLNKLK